MTATLAPDFDDVEPRLNRQDYSSKVLADQFHAKPREVRRFLNDQLEAGHTRELADRMLAVSLLCDKWRLFAWLRIQSHNDGSVSVNVGPKQQ